MNSVAISTRDGLNFWEAEHLLFVYFHSKKIFTTFQETSSNVFILFWNDFESLERKISENIQSSYSLRNNKFWIFFVLVNSWKLLLEIYTMQTNYYIRVFGACFFSIISNLTIEIFRRCSEGGFISDFVTFVRKKNSVT